MESLSVKGTAGTTPGHPGHSEGGESYLSLEFILSHIQQHNQMFLVGMSCLTPVVSKVFKHIFYYIIYQDSYDFKIL